MKQLDIKTINNIIIISNIVFVSSVLYFIFFISINNNKIFNLQNDRFSMVQVADKLRQSSDDLTHFARTYVETADILYKKQYFDTLNIRNGLKERPYNYDKIYWDLNKKARQKRHPDGEKISLKVIMSTLPYSKEELQLLNLSEKNSNDLVDLEMEAFNAMDGLYKDGQEKFSIKKQVNQKLAIKLMHSKSYYNAKHKIMNPIDKFMILLDKRTLNEVLDIQEKIKVKVLLLYFLIAFIFCVDIYLYLYLREVNSHIRTTLKIKVDEALRENRKKDELLSRQSKLASMGEMIGNIAHQWRQPLSALAVRTQFMEDDFEDGLIDKEYVSKHIVENMKLINFMSETIDDFRKFFISDKKRKEFEIITCIHKPMNILKPQLEHLNINLELKGENFTLYGLQSEFQQVILNIINNARDALVENKINPAQINIHTSKEENSGIIKINDNAEGIPEDIIHRVFEPYYTTKEEGKGTGIGLYMSKMIIEQMGAQISVHNDKVGACFVISVKLST